MNKIKRLILTVLLILTFKYSNAIVFPIPIPIINNVGGNNSKIDYLIGFYLAFNFYLIVYFLLRAIIYPFIKSKIEWTEKWTEFVFSDRLVSNTYSDFTIGLALMFLIIINAMALLFYTAEVIANIL